MFKFVWAIIATIVLMVNTATANTIAPVPSVQGMRFLEMSSQDDVKWRQFLDDLKTGITLTIKVGETETQVPGFNPETREIYLAAVRGLICANQTPDWRAACARTDLATLAAHNGWTGEKIHEAELRKQARAGLFFPPSEADLAVGPLRQEIIALEGRIALLKEEQKKAVTPEQVVNITAKLAAETAARQALERRLKDEMSTVALAAGEAAAKAAAPAVRQSADALNATKTLSGKVATAASQAASAAADAAAVNGRVSAVEKKANFGLWAAAGVGLLALAGIAGLAAWNMRQGKAIKSLPTQVQAGIDNRFRDLGATAKQSLEKELTPLRQKQQAMDTLLQGATDTIGNLSCRVYDLEQAQRAEPGSVTLPPELMVDLAVWPVGKAYPLRVLVTREEGAVEDYLVTIEVSKETRGDGRCYLITEGIDRHDPNEPVRERNLLGALHRAGGRGGKPMRYTLPITDFQGKVDQSDVEVEVGGGMVVIDPTPAAVTPPATTPLGGISPDEKKAFEYASTTSATGVVLPGGRRLPLERASTP